MNQPELLPLSKIVLPMKSKILEKFDRLEEGESITILNDQNPFLLFYQLLQDRVDTFSWEYLDKTPGSWRVKITKQGNP